jgi:hypothetical protein
MQDGPEVVVGHVDHDAPAGCVGAPVAHRTLRGERLSRPAQERVQSWVS